MGLRQVDEALAGWKAALSAVAENLLELQTETTFQSLSGTGGLSQLELTGQTAARVGPALHSVHGLFQRFGLLQTQLDRAVALRSQLPSFFGADARLQEIERLLFARSIELEELPVPLPDRTLAGAPRQRVRLSAHELLTQMQAQFTTVRDLVNEVGTAWESFGLHLGSAEASLESLQRQRALPSQLLAAELDTIAGILRHAGEVARTDPFGAMDVLQKEAEPALAQAAGRVAEAEALCCELAAARVEWDALAQLHGQAQHAAERLAARCVASGATEQPTSEGDVAALGAWLHRLEHKGAEGGVAAVQVGLRRWKEVAEGCQARDRRVLQAAEAGLALRAELRGRFSALEAKARSSGALRATEPVARLCAEAATLLHTRPTDLYRAGALLQELEVSLRPAPVHRQGSATP